MTIVYASLNIKNENLIKRTASTATNKTNLDNKVDKIAIPNNGIKNKILAVLSAFTLAGGLFGICAAFASLSGILLPVVVVTCTILVILSLIALEVARRNAEHHDTK